MKKPKPHPDTVRLDWLAKQDKLNFTGLSPDSHGAYVRYGDRFASEAIRMAIDAAMKASRRSR